MSASVFPFPDNAVFTKNSQPVTTSRIVAEVFGKRHDHVIRDIRNLECSEDFRLLNFGESSYVNEQNKVQPMFELTKDGFIFLVMGFTGAEAARRKEAYIKAFNMMEEALRAIPGRSTVTVDAMEFENLKLRLELSELKLSAGHKRRPFTDSDRATMRSLKAQGYGNAEIARRMGRSKDSIETFFYQKRGTT
jgi:Rha family phage regulatory protein